MSTSNGRYFVVSSQNYVIRGTKESGYASYKNASRARSRIDERDFENAKGFVPMKIVLD